MSEPTSFSQLHNLRVVIENLKYLVSVAENEEERKRFEERLEESQQQLKTAIAQTEI